MRIRQDILTPKERVMALLTGKPLDRIICMPILTSNTVKLIGKTVKEFQLDGKVMAESHIAGFRKFGYDLIYLFTNCSYVAEAMGAGLSFWNQLRRALPRYPTWWEAAIIRTPGPWLPLPERYMNSRALKTLGFLSA